MPARQPGDSQQTGKSTTMDACILQALNGLDKGGAYALIALGLTLIFGTLGVVNFAHGALFMLGAFCAVTMQKLLTLSKQIEDTSVTFFKAYKEVPYLEIWWGDTGAALIDYSEIGRASCRERVCQYV